MIVRLATDSDCEQVLGLLNQLGEIINEFVHFDPDNTRVLELGRENYHAAMKREDRLIFLVEDEGKILGVATFFILIDFMSGRPFAHIDDFIVEKNHRGEGIGTMMLEHIKIYAKSIGIHVIELTSSLPLTKAHAFYESRGGKFGRKVIKFEL